MDDNIWFPACGSTRRWISPWCCPCRSRRKLAKKAFPSSASRITRIFLTMWKSVFRFLSPGARGGGLGTPAPASAPTLEVVNVGDFEASFVPTVADFTRLDERFRLPAGTWDKLPAYRKFGFAVFKLKKGTATIHPMAFSFPRANPDILFFPTVHIHDGEVHETAHFDHVLYCQAGSREQLALGAWMESHDPAGKFVKKDKAGDVIEAERHVYKRNLWGDLPNQDTILITSASYSQESQPERVKLKTFKKWWRRGDLNPCP